MKKVLIALAFAALVFSLIWIKKSGITESSKAPSLEAYHSDFNSGNLDGVIKSANIALDSKPDDIDALVALATTYAMKGSVGFSEKENGKKAIEYVDRLLAINPNSSEAYRIKGYAFEIQEQYFEAHQNYAKAIELNGNNFQAWSNKGHAYDLQGDLKKAEELYAKSLKIYPTGEHALLNMARLRFRQNNLSETQSLLSTLINTTKAARLKAEAYQILAEVHRAEHNDALAREAIEKSIANDPSSPQAWVTRGNLELKTFMWTYEADERAKVFKNVIDYANKALAINSNQASAYLLLSDAELFTGDTKKHKDYKDQALRAVDLDITLGQNEKAGMKNFLSLEVQVTVEEK